MAILNQLSSLPKAGDVVEVIDHERGEETASIRFTSGDSITVHVTDPEFAPGDEDEDDLGDDDGVGEDDGAYFVRQYEEANYLSDETDAVVRQIMATCFDPGATVNNIRSVSCTLCEVFLPVVCDGIASRIIVNLDFNVAAAVSVQAVLHVLRYGMVDYMASLPAYSDVDYSVALEYDGGRLITIELSWWYADEVNLYRLDVYPSQSQSSH